MTTIVENSEAQPTESRFLPKNSVPKQLVLAQKSTIQFYVKSQFDSTENIFSILNAWLVDFSGGLFILFFKCFLFMLRMSKRVWKILFGCTFTENFTYLALQMQIHHMLLIHFTLPRWTAIDIFISTIFKALTELHKCDRTKMGKFT